MKPDIQTSSPDASLQDKLLIVSTCQGCVCRYFDIERTIGIMAVALHYREPFSLIPPNRRRDMHRHGRSRVADQLPSKAVDRSPSLCALPASPPSRHIGTAQRVTPHLERVTIRYAHAGPAEKAWLALLQTSMQVRCLLRSTVLLACRPIDAGEEVEWKLRGLAGQFPVGWFALQNCKRLQ